MLDKDLLYQISLTKVFGIGCVQARVLLEKFGTAENVFKAKRSEEHTSELQSH